MAKFMNTVKVAGRQYKRWSVTGTFSTTSNVVEKYKNDFYVAPGDIVRWKSNNQMPFGDVLLDLCEALYITPKQLKKTCELKEKENTKFWEKLEWGKVS